MEQGKLNKWADILVIAGLLIMAVMALLPLLNINLVWMRWAFAAGALKAAQWAAGRQPGIYTMRDVLGFAN